MNAHTTIEANPLAKLREPFAPNHISKLPKPTKAQTEAVRGDFKKGVRCKECGSWHHPDVVHLDYVGHAALTDRLLDTDPTWFWEPVAFSDGLPAFDQTGGLWIRLTVCGVTRLGYGNADKKPNQDAGAREKEVIGDALRNAAMRFGAALDLWHKGDLHADEEPVSPAAPVLIDDSQWATLQQLLERTRSDVKRFCEAYKIKSVRDMPAALFAEAKGKLDLKLHRLVEEQRKAESREFADVTEADVPF
jgi:hypothetical protein